jgi:hypothetical protein
MTNIEELALAKFHSESAHLYESSDDLALEDVRFIKYTELLENAGVFKNITCCRFERNAPKKKSAWRLMGYSFTTDLVSEEIIDAEDEFDLAESEAIKEYEWSYTIFNGVFLGENIPVSTVKPIDIRRAVEDSRNFIEATLSSDRKGFVQDYHAVKDLQEHLFELDQKGILDRIEICIITDGVVHPENFEKSIFIESINRECRIHYWGINKWSELSKSKNKRLPISIDFTSDQFKHYNIQFLGRDSSETLKNFLTICPGDLIADLYDEYGTQLLENNVRVFLSLKNKYNGPMSRTIATNPELFFSYNNGLSATAAAIRVDELTGRILAITDLQIVNGGQTTATLYHTKRHLKKSLTNVYVQVKISVLKRNDKYSGIIKDISRFANSQSAIKQSDFWTNDPFLIDFERVSSKNPIQIDGNLYFHFFERMAGQYKETKSRKGSAREIAAWERQYPKRLVFNKIELARWYNAMRLLPNVAVGSAEKQFDYFMRQDNKPEVTDSRYKTLVGFGMLCERARKVTGKKNSKEFPPIISDPNVGMATSIYAMSFLHHITEGRLDYHAIFNQTLKVEDLDAILKSVIKRVWEQIYQFDKVYTRDKTKVEACWKFVVANTEVAPTTLNKLERYLISKSELELRDANVQSEEFQYFELLNKLTENECYLIACLNDLVQTNRRFKRHSSKVDAIVKRINDESILIPLSLLKEINEVLDEIIKYKLSIQGKGFKKVEVDFLRLSRDIFQRRHLLIETLDLAASKKSGIELDLFMSHIEQLKELMDKFDIYPGLSINEFHRIQKLLIEVFNTETEYLMANNQ